MDYKQIYILIFFWLLLPNNLFKNTDMCFGKQEETISQTNLLDDDSCIIAEKIKRTILEYLNNENDLIYTKEFILYFEENNKFDGCFFPRNNDETNLYFKLADSCLLKKINSDNRAMYLLIDLYLVNWINVEFSEYYASEIVPKAALANLSQFVDVISKHSDKDINKCVSILKYLDKNDREKMKSTLSKIKSTDHQMIINKIKIIITST
jgi:hypothetical protein